MTERSGTTGVAPDTSERRSKCFACGDWYTWPTDESGQLRSCWPEFTTEERFVGACYCRRCAEQIHNRRESP